ncbi:hypothetical protein SRHO_G00293050 [Serrasalmus rhombeus]
MTHETHKAYTFLITAQTNVHQDGGRTESRSQMPNNGNEISEECVSAQSNWEKCNLVGFTLFSAVHCV